MSRELVGIVARMKELEQTRQDVEAEQKVLWDRFYAIADDVAGEGASYKYVDKDAEATMARSAVNYNPTVNPSKLQELLPEAQWKIITRTERVLDMALLEKAVASGRVSKEDVTSVTEQRDTSFRRKFDRASNKELEEIS